MIVDRIANARLYLGLSKRLDRGLRYLMETDLSAVAPGRYDLDGTNVYALVMDYETKPIEKAFYEAHRKYIDIQVVASGAEWQGWTNVNELAVDVPYDAEKDVIKLKGQGTMLPAPAGTFLIYFPHDAHMPAVAVDKPAPVRKVVVKALAG